MAAGTVIVDDIDPRLRLPALVLARSRAVRMRTVRGAQPGS
jgi:hypothetical protein